MAKTLKDANVEYKKVNDNDALVTATSDGKIYEVEIFGFTDEDIEAIKKLKKALKEKLSKNRNEEQTIL